MVGISKISVAALAVVGGVDGLRLNAAPPMAPEPEQLDTNLT